MSTPKKTPPVPPNSAKKTPPPPPKKTSPTPPNLSKQTPPFPPKTTTPLPPKTITPVPPQVAKVPAKSEIVPIRKETAPVSKRGRVDLNKEDLAMSTDEIIAKCRLLDNEIRIMKNQAIESKAQIEYLADKTKQNNERVKVNKHLPYLVSTVVEVMDLNSKLVDPDQVDSTKEEASKKKCAVIKTSTRTTYFLPNTGLLDPTKLKPGDMVGVNKDSHIILEMLPAEYDNRVKAMELTEKPKEDFTDIGGLDKQIEELTEAVLWPLKYKEKFKALGIVPSKGVLLYGPPGTGKTLMARAIAAKAECAFLKLAGPQLVQMFIGDGAKLVRDCFTLAKEKAPTIIFMDEIDALGTKRFSSEKAGDREVQRTMLELLSQLDGFQPNDNIKVIVATNRVDVLDPALIRSGRLDRKIELPLPDERGRTLIMKIHTRKMNVHKNVNFDELSRTTDGFNAAQCKAVCTEAGMIALRRNATIINHEDFAEGLLEVQARKKNNLDYYA